MTPVFGWPALALPAIALTYHNHMFNNRLKKIIFIAVAYFATWPLEITKAITVDDPGQRFTNVAGKAGFGSIPDGTKVVPQKILINAIVYLLSFVGLFFLAMIIYSGLQWINAGGNEQVIEKSKTRIKNAAIGFAVVMISFVIVMTVVNALNTSIEKPGYWI